MADNLKLNFQQTEDDINILLACTGAAASTYLPSLVDKLQNLHIKSEALDTNESLHTVNVRVVATEHAKHFFKPGDLSVMLYEDGDERSAWNQRGDPVLHIELRNWASVLVIAPLGANTLAKLANGLCDNLLTLVFRAWDFSKPVFYATGMNTLMWEHPLTRKDIVCMAELGCVQIPCIEKVLFSGYKGMGAMADIHTIAEYVREYFDKKHESIN